MVTVDINVEVPEEAQLKDHVAHLYIIDSTKSMYATVHCRTAYNNQEPKPELPMERKISDENLQIKLEFFLSCKKMKWYLQEN